MEIIVMEIRTCFVVDGLCKLRAVA